MTCFVACHFMNGVVNCVKSFFFGAFCKFKFAFGCAVFGFYAFLKIFFGGRADKFAEKFAEFCSVFCFFKCGFFPVKTNFGITFTVCRSCHCEIHADFGAFAFKVCFETVVDVFGDVLTDANDMFGSPNLLFAVVFDEFATRATALRASFWCAVSFVYVSADRTDKFCHSCFSLKRLIFYFTAKADFLLVIFAIRAYSPEKNLTFEHNIVSEINDTLVDFVKIEEHVLDLAALHASEMSVIHGGFVKS